MECVLRKFGSYEKFEEVTGGSILPKSQVWAAVRKYLHKEGCVGEVSAEPGGGILYRHFKANDKKCVCVCVCSGGGASV